MIFIDLARALAVVFMLYGHTVSAVLDPEYQRGAWFAVWQFQRGLTSPLFLLLSGFAFSIATTRHWASHTALSWSVVRRVRRFALFILLGYALHFPVTQFTQLPDATPQQWRALLGVDVLQLIGVTFIAVQLLVLTLRSRQVFMAGCLALAAVVTFVAPSIWRVDWRGVLPLSLGSYLSPLEGSLFPLFPWSAFVLLGAGMGQIYARWGAAHLSAFTRQGLFFPGIGLVVAAVTLKLVPVFGTDAPGVVPGDVVMRAGTCFIILAAVAQLSRHIHHLPHVFGALAQETLLIYFVHLCLVYGSIWNKGYAQTFGATLTPVETLGCVVLLVVGMAALATYWNWWKHTRPRLARWTMYTAWGLLLYKLI